MSSWSDLRDRIAGKWQVPLLAVSVLALAASFLKVKPTSRDYPIAEAVGELDAFLTTGRYSAALGFAEPILQLKGQTEAQLAPVHLRIARALVARSARDGAGSPEIGRDAVQHFELARDHRQSVTALDHERWGQALEWQDLFDQAVRHYEQAIASSDQPLLDLRKHVLSLQMSKLDAPLAETRARLEEFMRGTNPLPHGRGSDRLDLSLWAIERLVDVLHDQGKTEQAATLLARHEDEFSASDLRDRFAYLRALVLYRTGAPDEAELLLRAIRNRVATLDETDAMSGYLLGRIVLGEDGLGRPFEAISFFENVIAVHALGPYRVASRLGIAEALVSLQRQGEAIDAYRIAIEEAQQLGEHRLVNRDVLRVSLIVNSNRARQRGQFAAALGYAELASELIDERSSDETISQWQRLGDLHEALAQQLLRQADEVLEQGGDDAGQLQVKQRLSLLSAARRQFDEAADEFVKLAAASHADQDRAAAGHFHAAELCDLAFNRSRAADLYESFITDYPSHGNVSLALLRLGHVRREMGLSAEAVEAYRQCRSRFPQSLNGARALLPLARTYLAMRPPELDLTEKTLMLILDDSRVFTPDAREYADALFMLGDVLNRRGEFERAITVLEEARRRYPKAPQVWRSLYLLADAYRQSGMALKNDLKDARFVGEVNQIQAQYRERLGQARELYRNLIDHYESMEDASLERIDRVYQRHALLYEADCLYENMRYAEAVKLYEAAVGSLSGSTAALSAYVQIINCQAFLGQPLEARAALTRAQVLVRNLPDESFARDFSPETRKDWQRYLSWLERSDLF